MSGRILVIRGGAIGDFVLTLPAIHLLRSAFPSAHIEIMGYRSIAAIAENRFYAQASRSIEYAPLSRFFTKDTDLPSDLVRYFSSFHQIVSYLYDPDSIFSGNLTRAGAKDLICGPGKILPHQHATAQLAAPLEKLALYLEDPCAHLYPSTQDLATARQLSPLSDIPDLSRCIAIHPGSGGKKKNWPTSRWLSLLDRLLAEFPDRPVAVLGGEADSNELSAFQQHTEKSKTSNRVFFLADLPLPTVAAFLHLAGVFLGHDSGISHIAAAAGCPSLLLFGPTDPAIWAPKNPQIRILHAPSSSMDSLSVDSVFLAALPLLMP